MPWETSILDMTVCCLINRLSGEVSFQFLNKQFYLSFKRERGTRDDTNGNICVTVQWAGLAT